MYFRKLTTVVKMEKGTSIADNAMNLCVWENLCMGDSIGIVQIC